MNRPQRIKISVVWLACMCITPAGLASAGAPATQLTGRHTQRVSGHSASLEITVPGTADQRRMGGWVDNPTSRWNPTQSLSISNVGQQPVVNPRVIVENGPDWFDIDSIVRAFVRPGMSDEEKSFALWQWCRHRISDGPTFEGSLWGDTRSMARFMNAMGTGACGTFHIVMPVIGVAAGLRTFSGCFADCSHAVQHEFFDGQPRFLDAHIPHGNGQPRGWFALQLDNRQVAGVDDIMADRYLIDRAGSGPERFDYVTYFGPGCKFHEEKRDWRDPHQMSITLRPGESIRWDWKLSAPAWQKDPSAIKQSDAHCSGTVEFTPHLEAACFSRDGASVRNVGVQPEGKGVAPQSPQDPAVFVYQLHCPYPITRIATDGRCRIAGDGRAAIAWSLDGSTYMDLVEQSDSGTRELRASVDEHERLREPKLTHDVWFRVKLEGAGTVLEKLTLRADFMAYRLSLPSLYCGRNRIRYSAEQSKSGTDSPASTADDQVLIEYRWRAMPDLPVPQPSAKPVHPEDGGHFGFNETLRWQPAKMKDDGKVDSYEIYISPRQDLAWPVLPNTHRLTGSAETAFKLISPDALRHGATYYWRVRGRSDDGVWGEWSKTWSFVAAGPHPPRDLKASFDPSTRQATLSWQPPEGGEAVDHYEIYASSEHGFSPLRETETAEASGKTYQRPATLLATTSQTGFDVTARPEAFFRVAAVDKHGNRSVVTPIAALPTPALLPVPLKEARAGEAYQAQIPARLRAGRLAKSLRKGMIVDGADTPRFRVEDKGGATWLEISEQTGELTGKPNSAGSYRIRVMLENGRGGKAEAAYELHVQP